MTTNWTTKKLRDLLQIQNGYAFDSKKFDAARGVPLGRVDKAYPYFDCDEFGEAEEAFG